LDARAFADSLEKQRRQLERGALIYVAYQVDMLVGT
jgi:hypothetical protein